MINLQVDVSPAAAPSSPSIHLHNSGSLRLLKNLPLLSWTSHYYSSVDLRDTLIIGVQHLYATNYNMFLELFNHGLRPENLYVMGKCYSADPAVCQQLKLDGVAVSDYSTSFDSHRSYDAQFKENLSDFINEIENTVKLHEFKTIVLLDDGGNLIDLMNKKYKASLPLVAVEQTSAGYNRLSRKKIAFPIVNVARSRIKLTYESPIIIALSLRKMKEKIAALRQQPQTILIIGYGTLGALLHQTLGTRYTVYYYDKTQKRSMLKDKELNDLLPHVDLVIGASGETCLTRDHIALLKKPVTLASISSSDREFDILHLRREVPPSTSCHQDLVVRDVRILNSGFPVNFDSDFSSIDTDNFQITRSVILAGIMQAATANKSSSGFNSLAESFQQEIEAKIQEFSLHHSPSSQGLSYP